MVADASSGCSASRARGRWGAGGVVGAVGEAGEPEELVDQLGLAADGGPTGWRWGLRVSRLTVSTWARSLGQDGNP